MVEKIRRDVRITTIYEGTSEIMEMTISRDRWQQHLKTRGRYYHDEAAKLETLAQHHPQCGAAQAALGLHALAETLERCRVARLTRHQHVLFRLGDLISRAEGAGALARRAARRVEGTLDARSDRRFEAESLCALSRACARETAHEVATQGLRWVTGSDGVGAAEAAALATALGLPAIQAAQAGLMADLDRVADALYERQAAAAR